MVQFSRFQSVLLTTVLVTTSVSALPLQAAIRQEPHQPLTRIKGNYLAFSWMDIWNKLRRQRGSGGSRGSVCAIAPANLLDPDAKPENTQVLQEVWSESPLFLWKITEGKAQQIELFIPGSENWKRDIKAGETKVVYDGKALQPGQSYEWQLTALAPFPKKSVMFRFQVMESEKRDRISAELRQREGRLKGASQEKIALEKANFFAEKGLWADALRELYSVPNPSAELTGVIKQIEAHDFSQNDESNTSSS